MATIERITREYIEKQQRNGDRRNQLFILKDGLSRYIQQYQSVAKRFNQLNADYKELKEELAKQEEPYAPASPQYSSSPQYSGEEEKQDFPQNVVVEQKALCAIDKALLRSKLRKEAKLALLDTTSNYKKKLIEEKDERKRCFKLNTLLRRKNDRLEVALEMATLPKAEPEPEYKVVKKVSREKLDAKLKAKKEAKEPEVAAPKKKRRPLAFIKEFQEVINTPSPPEKKRGRPAKEPVEKVAKKRGRPKKEAPAEPKVPKKRGRPFGATAEASKLKKQVVPLGDILKELKVPYSEIQKRFEEEIGEKVERGFIKTAQFKKFVEGLKPNELQVQYSIQNYFDKLGAMPTTTLKEIREDFEKSSGISLDEWRPLFKKIAVKYAESANK